MGDTAVAGVDFDIGASNRIENGTETFYLVIAPDPAAIVALEGANLDANMDGRADIECLGLDIREMVAVTDGDTGDRVYDGGLQNTLGPDGTFMPGEEVIDAPEADALMSRTYREGWEL